MIGETPRLWSSFPVIVKTRNMSVMSEILSSRKMKQLKKLRIISTLSEEVSQTIINHPVLREFKLSRKNDKQTIISVLNVICSREYKGTVLDMSENNMLDIDPELLAKVVTKLQKLNIDVRNDFRHTNITHQQAAAILTAVSEGSTLTELKIGYNNLSGVDLELLAKVVTNLDTLNLTNTKLTQQQIASVITSASKGSKLKKLNISENDLSGVDPGLLAKAVVNLETLDIGNTKLTQQQAAVIFSGVCEGSRLNVLNISENNLSEVEPELLAKTVIKLKKLDIQYSDLTKQQASVILTAISEGRRLTDLNIGFNDLRDVCPELMAKAVTNLEILDVTFTDLTQQQATAIITTISNGSKLIELHIFGDDLSGVDPKLLANIAIKLEILEIGMSELTQQQTAAIFTAISEGINLTTLDIRENDLSGVDPELLANAVTNLEKLNIEFTELTQQQAAAILSNVSEATKLNELNIRSNDLFRVDPGLLAKVVTNLEKLDIANTFLIQEQAVAILSGVINGSKMTQLDIGLNDLSGVDPGLLAKARTNLETLWETAEIRAVSLSEIGMSELTQQQTAAIYTAISEGINLTTL